MEVPQGGCAVAVAMASFAKKVEAGGEALLYLSDGQGPCHVQDRDVGVVVVHGGKVSSWSGVCGLVSHLVEK